jgi:hypothetical protein
VAQTRRFELLIARGRIGSPASPTQGRRIIVFLV